MRKVTISYPALTQGQHEQLLKATESNYEEIYEAVTGQKCHGAYHSCWYYNKRFHHFSSWNKLKADTTSVNHSEGTLFEKAGHVEIVFPELSAMEFERLLQAETKDLPAVFTAITGLKYDSYKSAWIFGGMFFHANSSGKIDKMTNWHDPANVTKDPWPESVAEARPLTLAERFKKVSEHSIDVLEDNGLRTTFNFMMQHIVVDNQKPGTTPAVVNFDDVQRQGAIIEAYEKLVEMGGNPPDPTVIDMPGKKKRGPGGLTSLAR